MNCDRCGQKIKMGSDWCEGGGGNWCSDACFWLAMEVKKEAEEDKENKSRK